MSRAAETSPPSPAKALSAFTPEGRQMNGETTGCTAIIFLDAPLITPRLKQQRRFYSDEQPQPSMPRPRPSLATEESAGLKKLATAVDADAPALTRDSDISDIGLLDRGGAQYSDENRGDDGADDDEIRSAQHPAGIGDPDEALEAFLLWIEEAESSGLGRREVLLVCNEARHPRYDGEKDQNATPHGIPQQSERKAGGSPKTCETPSENEPPVPPNRLPHSEVLLQTRPLPSQAESESRVAVMFAPPSLRAVSAVLSSPSERKEHSSEGRLKTKLATRQDTTTQESVRVLVGPVVGHVGPTSAVVLAEVNAVDPAAVALATVPLGAGRREGVTGVGATADAVGVQLTDTLTGQRRQVSGGEWTGGQSGSGPQVFKFRGLSPGRRYTLKLLGVRQRDQQFGQALDEILADIQTARPTATATLAIGPMVEASKAAQALYPLIMAETEAGTTKKGGLSLGARALGMFRQLYRHAWNEPRMRKLLANTANTSSSPGAGDLVLPLLRNFPNGWLPCITDDHSNPLVSSGIKARRGVKTRRASRARTRKVNSVYGRPRQDGGVARALRTVAEAALQVSKEYQGALLDDSINCGPSCGVYQMPLGGVTGRGGPLPTFQTCGAVGVLNISVASSQIDWACGGRDAGRRLLSRETWAWLEDFFRSANVCLQGPTLNTLIVVTDSPLVWRSASSTAAHAPAEKLRSEAPWDTRRDHEGHDRGGRRLQAATLLSLLFSWVAAETIDGNDDRDASTCTAATETPTTNLPGKSSGTAEKGWTATFWSSSRRRQRSKAATGRERRDGGRAFSVVCPATRVRMNIETYVKDSETGHVAVQWCVASSLSGDESLIPMSGNVGPRFSFTHYPQAGNANGPGATLIRPIPDPCAPCTKFLGLAPLGDRGSGGGGPGFAFGTLGPILGEVGTSTARILVEVSVPMELRLTIQKSGTRRRDNGPESAGNWQELSKIIRNAHRPVVFEVDGLIPDTRYAVDFAPLANATEFRASLRTRPIRPFSFRVAAFGGSRNPFGFLPSAADGLPKSAIKLTGSRVAAVNEEDAAAAESGEIGAGITVSSGESRLLRERWPYCTVGAVRRPGAPGDAVTANSGESGSGTTTKAESHNEAYPQGGTKRGLKKGWAREFCGADEHVGAEMRSAAAGGGWRHAGSTASAVMVATDGSCLAEMKRESLLGSSGSGDGALSACTEFNRLSAWKAMADEVELPGQGLDLIIHLGNELNAAASLSEIELNEIAESFTLETRRRTQTPFKEALPPTERMTIRKRGRRPLLVRPPQLPMDDPTTLGERDEEDVSQLGAFLIKKLHDGAERDRKRGDGDFRHRRIAEPPLAVRIHFPEDPTDREENETSSGGGADTGVAGDGGSGAGEVDDGEGLDGGVKADGLDASEGKPDGDGVGDEYAWSLVAEEVAERARDPYRVAWGLPWAKTVMSRASNALMAYTPLDLDGGCEEQVRSLRADDPQAAGPRPQPATGDGEDHQDFDHPAFVEHIREERLRAWVEYQTALAPGGDGGRKAPPGSDTAATEESDNKDNNAKGGGEKGNRKTGGGGGKSKIDKRETDRGGYREYGGIGVLLLDVWANQPWRLDKAGMATAKGGDQEDPGFHPKALLSKRQEKLVKKALTSSSVNALIICSGTPMVAEPVVHPKAPPLSDSEQKIRDKTLSVAKKELKKLGKAGLAEIKRMEEEEKIPKLAMLSPEEVGAMDAFYDESRPCFHWSYHSPYLQAREEGG
ncbi:unnamed protein product, partial [Hapterophycus canaliculatus]